MNIASRVFLDVKQAKAEREIARRIGMGFLAALGSEKAQAVCAREKIAVKAAGDLTNAGGGFLVAEEMETAIVGYRELAGVIRSEADVRRMGSDSLSVPRSVRAAAASFVGENLQVSALDVEIGNIGLRAKKAMALVLASTEVAEDAIADFGSEAVADFGQAFAVLEDSCGFNGDGTSTYAGMTGVLTLLANSSLAGSVSAAAGHDTLAEVDANDVAELIARLPEHYLGDAKFYCSAAGLGTFVKLGATPFGSAPTIRGTRPRFQYGGFEIRPCPRMPGRGSQTGKPIVLFGEMHAGVILGDRRGITVRTSTQRYFEKDQIAVKATQRFEVVAHNLGDAAQAGAMVGLLGA